jgi:hypothetical protein
MLHTFFGTRPQICASTQSCLGALRTVPSPTWLGFCSDTLPTVGPYIDRCVPFQIMSNQLNLPQVDSNNVVDKYLKDDQLKQEAPEFNFDSHSKGSEFLGK